MYLIISVITTFLCVSLLVQVLWELWERGRARARLRETATDSARRTDLRASVLSIVSMLASGLERRLPQSYRDHLAQEIDKAGWQGWHPGQVALAQAGSFLAALSLGLLLDLGAWTLAAGLVFAFLPLLSLNDASNKKLAALRKALPDALDLLCSCVEAGLSFDLALARIAQRLDQGPLRQELELCLSQMKMGQTRREALRNLARRANLDDLSALVGALVQADQMGAPLGPALRAQSGQLRALRSLRVQKLAAQAPVKMLFPLMVFILPVVFLVLFGPLFIKWSQGGF